jgi:hypothetical protein
MGTKPTTDEVLNVAITSNLTSGCRKFFQKNGNSRKALIRCGEMHQMGRDLVRKGLLNDAGEW